MTTDKDQKPAEIAAEHTAPAIEAPAEAVAEAPPAQPEASFTAADLTEPPKEDRPDPQIEPLEPGPVGEPINAGFTADDAAAQTLPGGAAGFTDAGPQTVTDQAEPPAEGPATTPAPAVKKGFLSKVWSFAVSAGVGAAIGLAAKTCAVAALCTAGAPALVTTIASMAVAGAAVGIYKAYRDHKEAKKTNPELSFLKSLTSRQGLTKLALHTAISVAAGSIVMAYGDEIMEAGKNIYDSLFGTTTPPVVVPVPVPDETAQALKDQLAAVNKQLADEQAARLLAEQQAKQLADQLAAEQTAKLAAQEQAQKLADQLAQEQAAKLLAEQEAQRLADQLAQEQAARLAAEQEAARLAEAARIAAEQEAARIAAEQEAARIAALPKPHTVANGENLWNIVKAHYNLSSNADIQRYVDGVALANDLGNGTAANNIAPGKVLQLPNADTLKDHVKLGLNWKALDAQTAARLAMH